MQCSYRLLPYVIPKKIKHKCFPYDDIENEIMWLTNTDEEKEMVWLTENHVLPFEWVHVEGVTDQTSIFNRLRQWYQVLKQLPSTIEAYYEQETPKSNIKWFYYSPFVLLLYYYPRYFLYCCITFGIFKIIYHKIVH